jgi:hypothetical protein
MPAPADEIGSPGLGEPAAHEGDAELLDPEPRIGTLRPVSSGGSRSVDLAGFQREGGRSAR